MKPSVRLWVSLLAVMAVSVACGPTPPPEEPVPTADTAPPPPPPPPPKCEGLSEGCKAKPGTAAPIPGSDYVFGPPKGWIYAKLKKASVAQVDDKGSVLALAGYTPDAKAFAAKKQRDVTLAELAEIVGVQPPGGKLLLFQPDQTEEKGGFKMLYWQREQAKRGAEAGTLLVMSAEQQGLVLIGIGFVTSNDTSEADKAIMGAFQSIERKAGGASDDKASPDKSGSGKDDKSTGKDKAQ
jgi:hypothetical protein